MHKRNRKNWLASKIAIGALGLLFFSICFYTNTSATIETTSRVSVVLPEVLTLRILDSTATTAIEDLPLEATPTANGVFTKNSLIAEVATSNPSGYKLYLGSIGKDHSGNYTSSLINIDEDVPAEKGTINTLPANSEITESDFSIINSNYRNRWGYSTASLSETDKTAIIYNDVPAYSTKILINNQRSSDSHSTTPVTIGANITSGISSGIYRNILEFTAIANPPELVFSLDFDGNTTDTVANLPEPMSESSPAAQVTYTIPSVAPERDGFNFIEWNTELDGSGDSYSPGEDFTILADTSSPDATKKTLYAIWEEKVYTYRISYSCATGASNCPSSQTITGGKSIQYTVSNQRPALSGYTFAEYTLAQNVATKTGYYSLAPGQTITLNYGSNIVSAGTENEYDRITITAINYSTFTLGGKSWAGPMRSYSQYSSAASYCPSGYRLPTLAEVRTLIGTSGDEDASETNTNVISLVERLRTKGKAPFYNFWTSTAGSSGRYSYLTVISASYTRTNTTGSLSTQYLGVLCTK